MSGPTVQELAVVVAKLDSLERKIDAFLAGAPAPAKVWPPEVTLRQAMAITNHRAPQSFYDWCRRRRVRPLSRGRYSLRRLQAALVA